MALARTEDFHFDEMEVAEFARVISHPARVAILKRLAEKKECICGDLVLELPLAQSTVSQHLKALKEFGIIKGSIDGPRSKYCIDWKVFDRYRLKQKKWMDEIASLRQENCC